MTVLTKRGPEVVTVRDSRTASLLAEHANAVRTYIETGDETKLRALRRGHFSLRGRRIELALDEGTLDRLAAGGELQYEVYRR